MCFHWKISSEARESLSWTQVWCFQTSKRSLVGSPHREKFLFLLDFCSDCFLSKCIFVNPYLLLPKDSGQALGLYLNHGHTLGRQLGVSSKSASKSATSQTTRVWCKNDAHKHTDRPLDVVGIQSGKLSFCLAMHSADPLIIREPHRTFSCPAVKVLDEVVLTRFGRRLEAFRAQINTSDSDHRLLWRIVRRSIA